MIHSAAFSLSLVVSLFVALAIILTQRFHGHLTHDSHSGVQKLHHAPTPRVGGVALCAGAVAGGLLLPEGTRALWWVMSLSALPALVFGLIEDVTKRVGVKTRLLATICSGLIFCVASGYHVAQVGLPGLDLIFAFAAFAIPFTAFAVGGWPMRST